MEDAIEEVVEEVAEDVTPAEEVAEQEETAEEVAGEVAETETAEETQAEPEINQTTQELINRKIAEAKHKERRRYENDVAYWKGKATAAQPEPVAQVEDKAPTPEQFDDYDSYIDAKAGYIAEQKFREIQGTATKQAQANAHAQKVGAVMDKGNGKYEDFDQLTRSLTPHQMNDYTLMAITEVPNGDDLAYYLASNPDEATRVAGLSPAGMIMEYKQISLNLANPKKAPPSKAPKPISPVGNTGGTTDLEYREGMTSDEYAKVRAKRLKRT